MSAGVDVDGMPVQRVLLVEDHPIVRQGLKRLISNEPGLAVCGEAETLREARQAIRDLAPDVVVADISLKDGDGIDLVKEVRAHHPGLPVLVLSMHDESVYAERLLAAGASGYIMKDAASEQFILALRQVLAGQVYVSEAVAPKLEARQRMPAKKDEENPVSRLSNRELQILQMIGRGLSSRQIAETLHLSIKTIEAHRQRIKGKLELASGAQLVQFAAHWVAGH
jgi:DNA-binding NarL/FixJ family response regulator